MKEPLCSLQELYQCLCQYEMANLVMAARSIILDIYDMILQTFTISLPLLHLTSLQPIRIGTGSVNIELQRVLYEETQNNAGLSFKQAVTLKATKSIVSLYANILKNLNSKGPLYLKNRTVWSGCSVFSIYSKSFLWSSLSPNADTFRLRVT